MKPESGPAQRYFREVVLNYSGDECLIWPFHVNQKGYGYVQHEGRPHRVHRLVCQSVNGPAPSPTHNAAHTCGQCRCVARKHIRWASPAENESDKIGHGTHNRGVRNGLAKLTEADVRAILASEKEVSRQELAERFGVHKKCIEHIQRGDTWSWLTAAESAP